MTRATVSTLFPAVLRQLCQLLERHLEALYRLSDRTGLDLPRPDTGVVHLGAKQLRRLAAADGVGYLEVLQGTLWLTATPAGDDVLLREGDGIALTGPWPIVMQALEATRFILLPQPPEVVGQPFNAPAPAAPAGAPARGHVAR